MSKTTTSVRSSPLPATIGDVFFRTRYSLISTGTELLVARGDVPTSLHEEMRVPHMGGDFWFPVCYGYSCVGRMEARAPHEPVFFHLMAPHQDLVSVDDEELFEIPDGIPPKRATLASNLETVVNAVWDSGVSIGDRVLVTGFGLIGSLLCRVLAKIPGVQVCVMEIRPDRQALCRQMGFHLLFDHTVRPFDIAYHCSSSAEGLQSCIDLVGREGKVIELSWYGNRPVGLKLGESFHTMRKQILSSQVSVIPPVKQPRWNNDRRKALVFDLLRDPGFDAHITHTVSMKDAAGLFTAWRTRKPEGLGYCIDYSK